MSDHLSADLSAGRPCAEKKTEQRSLQTLQLLRCWKRASLPQRVASIPIAILQPARQISNQFQISCWCIGQPFEMSFLKLGENRPRKVGLCTAQAFVP